MRISVVRPYWRTSIAAVESRDEIGPLVVECCLERWTTKLGLDVGLPPDAAKGAALLVCRHRRQGAAAVRH